MQPLRSVLYMPGSNERALDKARTLDCDAIILDLEDAVAPAAKELARQAVRESLLKGGFGHRLRIVRLNALESPWGADDLAAFCDIALDALLLPKVRGAEDIAALDRAMTGAGYGREIAIWAMMETPLGILNARDIAFASERLRALVIGSNDLAKDMRIRADDARASLSVALALTLLSARAAGLMAVDGVFGRIGDLPGFEAECREGKAAGFDGKTLIHPSQIDAANRIFAPDPQEVEMARRIVACWDDEAARRGIAVLEGRMIERLHVDEARQLLDINTAIAARTQGT